MTDAEAITLLGDLETEALDEEQALSDARGDFAAAKQALNNAMSDVDSALARMDRHVRYAIDYFGV
ncbi:MAG: hypothetical protein L0L17_05990 [Yaniella sp.]|nr:hypothetical protein [Yaniella sp.]